MSEAIILSRELPEVDAEIFTTATAICGIRGSGKTNDGVLLAEAAIGYGIPVCIIDPTGVWYGLKSSSDGKRAGLPVYIFGGAHGDVPLEPDAGPIIARFLVENPVPIILDLSDLKKSAQRRFVGQFCEELYDLKARKRDTLLVIIDEVSRFAPQQLIAKDVEMARCLGAVEDIVSLGRSRGLGCAFIGQRPATINNNVLTQADNLIAMRTVGAADRKAIDAWVAEVQGDKAMRDEMVQHLPSLKQGQGYFWSPAIFDTFRRVKFAARTTFDSSRTPKAGEKRVEPRVFARVDLTALRGEIAAAVERAKSENPKYLRGQIEDLRHQLAAALQAKPPERIEVPVEVPVVPADLATDLRALIASFRQSVGDLRGMAERVEAGLAQLAAAPKRPVAPVHAIHQSQHSPPAAAPAPPVKASHASRSHVENPVSDDGYKLSKAERGILTALAMYPQGRTSRQVAILSGYSHTSGGFNNALGSLRSHGYIERGQPIRITKSGLLILGSYEPLPVGSALRDYWLTNGTLGKAERTILQALFEAHPHGLTSEEVAQRTGYSATSGGFNNALGRLRTLELITRGQPMRADDTFFAA